MKALILLADGFEVTEALLTADVFIRTHKIEVTLASIKPELEVTASCGIKVQADKSLIGLSIEDYDFLVLPGGKLGVQNLSSSSLVEKTIRAFFDMGKDVHAICAAPSILGKLGYLNDIPYTCFPGFEVGGDYKRDEGVVVTPRIVTGHSMGYSLDFAKAIVGKYFGEEGINAISGGIYGR